MLYSIKMILKRIRLGSISYLILSVQFAVGIAFIAYAANHLLSAGNMMQVVEEKVQETDIRIEPEMKEPGNESSQPPVTDSEYEEINRLMEGHTELNVYREEPSVIEEKSLYYLFTDAFQGKLDGESVYVSRRLYNAIQGENIEKLSDFITIQDGHVVDSWTGKEYVLNKIPKEMEGKAAIVNSFGTVLLSDCVVLPLRGLNDRLFDQYLLTIHVDGIDDWQTITPQFLDMLAADHEDYQYMQQNPMKEQRYYSDYMTVMPRYLGKLAVVMLFVLIFGFSGILHLYVKRREKEYCICYAMGALSSRICLEILTEIFIVCGAGMIIGNLVCLQIMKVKVFDSLFPVRYSPWTVLITLVITIAITFIVTFASILRIRKLEPARLLQSL